MSLQSSIPTKLLSLALCAALLAGCTLHAEPPANPQEEPLQLIEPETQEPEERIPFLRTPELASFTLPKEEFPDDLERRASEAIDSAIEKAVSCVLTMKDSRHSAKSYPWERDPNGYLAKLTDKGQSALERIARAGREFKEVKITSQEYGGSVKDLYFDIYLPLTYCEPALSSYLYVDADSRYTALTAYYFDPAKDANFKVSDGKTDMDTVKEGAELLDRIIKRVVRFMPEGLCTYDKYYYLAAVISEKVTYDKAPRNRFTPYGALVDGRAVCEGYSQAFFLLCQEAGLWCAFRHGLPKGEGHVWNMVRLESGIYNVDITWSDGHGEPYTVDWYDCFVKPDDDFDFDGHAITSGPKSTGTFEPCPYEGEKNT